MWRSGNRPISHCWRVLAILLFAAIPLAGEAAILKKDPTRNENLGAGDYRFWEYHLPWAGSFEDEWSFSLAQRSRISLETRSLDFSLFGFPLLGIDDLGVSLAPATSSSSSTSSARILSAVLDSGTYRFLVAGDVSGIFGGKYIGNLGVSAVPLPPALVLFAFALLTLTGMNKVRTRRAPWAWLHPGRWRTTG